MNAPSGSDNVNRAGDGGHNRANDNKGKQPRTSNLGGGSSSFSAMLAGIVGDNERNTGKVSISQINKTADQRDDEEKDHYERRKQPPIVNPSIRVQERMSKINDNKEELQEDFDGRRYGYGYGYYLNNLKDMSEEEREESITGNGYNTILSNYHNPEDQASRRKAINELASMSGKEVANINSNPKYTTPHLFQGNYDGKNEEISGIKYGHKDVDTEDDSKWTIWNNGCNLVSTVMAAEVFGAYEGIGTSAEHVKDAANFALGDHVDNTTILKGDDGTSFRFTHAYLNNLGLKTTETKDPKEVEEALARGAVVITSVQGDKYANGPTDTFTNNRHVMLLTSLNSDGTVNVNNPNRKGYNDYINGNDSYSLNFIDEHISMGYVIVEPDT